MNKLYIIGNLTKDAETRVTQSGGTVCSFTVAVNRRKTTNSQNQPETDYFHVSVWNKLAESCSKYLNKGKKVAVIGSVSVHTYQGNDGNTRAQLDVIANEVEFLTSRSENGTESNENIQTQPAQQTQDVSGNQDDSNAGYTPVDFDASDLPF